MWTNKATVHGWVYLSGSPWRDEAGIWLSLIDSIVAKMIPTAAGQPMAAARNESERFAKTRYLIHERPRVWQSLAENSIKMFRPTGETLYPLLGNHSSRVQQLSPTFQNSKWQYLMDIL